MFRFPHLFRTLTTTAWTAADNVTEQAEGVFFVTGPASNWVIVRDDSGFILIDGGYPNDGARVEESIRHLGLDPADALAILITHGHVDHTGTAASLSRRHGIPVLCSPEELAHVQGHEKHQVTLGQVLLRVWRPRVLKWMIHALRAGSLKAEPVPNAEAWTPERLLGLPGSPVAVLAPGHTPGNAFLHLPGADAVITGDTFVTGHPLSRHAGPQRLHPMYDSCPERAGRSLIHFDEIHASVILPGHGPALRMPLSAAVAAL